MISPLLTYIGIGNVSSVAYMTDVCRATDKKERTPILVGFSMAQQVRIKCSIFPNKTV